MQTILVMARSLGIGTDCARVDIGLDKIPCGFRATTSPQLPANLSFHFLYSEELPLIVQIHFGAVTCGGNMFSSW